MEKRKILIFVLVFGIILVGHDGSAGIYAQSSNNEQRLVGTWTNINNNSTIVFNSNGTMTYGSDNYKYGAAAYKLALYESSNKRGYTDEVFEFFISTDGRTLILIDTDGDAHVFRKNA